jgi:predicted lysophospholipase L1 biosynthesis ABC-type transport system permease subunit
MLVDLHKRIILCQNNGRADDVKASMGVFLRDLRFGVRQLLQRPGFAAVAIGSLALGIGLNVTIFSVVNGVLLRGQPVAQPDRLVEIYSGISKDLPH